MGGSNVLKLPDLPDELPLPKDEDLQAATSDARTREENAEFTAFWSRPLESASDPVARPGPSRFDPQKPGF
jgi:hypothetical protein